MGFNRTMSFEPEVSDWPEDGKRLYVFRPTGFGQRQFWVTFPIPEGDHADKIDQINRMEAEWLFRRALIHPETFRNYRLGVHYWMT